MPGYTGNIAPLRGALDDASCKPRASARGYKHATATRLPKVDILMRLDKGFGMSAYNLLLTQNLPGLFEQALHP
ncbi:MAG: hypothetical protein LUE93_12505 [Bacteroides sp.]|nr:hypothetical protein [Bacteroides sp.]